MTPSDGLINRWMKGSVDRALAMQPRRTSRVRDEYLYSAPSARELVAEVADAGRRLVDGGLAPRTAGAIAVRRNETTATRTALGADLSNLDNRMLESVAIDRGDPVVSAVRYDDAVILCWPPALSALDETLDPVPSLAERLPEVTSEIGPSRIVSQADGSWLVLAPTVTEAIEWIEVAEHAARMQSRRRP
jgi:hypothetical protein